MLIQGIGNILIKHVLSFPIHSHFLSRLLELNLYIIESMTNKTIKFQKSLYYNGKSWDLTRSVAYEFLKSISSKAGLKTNSLKPSDRCTRSKIQFLSNLNCIVVVRIWSNRILIGLDYLLSRNVGKLGSMYFD